MYIKLINHSKSEDFFDATEELDDEEEELGDLLLFLSLLSRDLSRDLSLDRLSLL